MATQPHGTTPDAHDDAHAHPGPRQYYIIAAILTVVTIAEVAIFYIEALAPALVPLLVVLTAAKFVLVVQFYMHLKFDSRIFSGVFLGPLALVVLLIISLIVIFKVLPEYKVLG
jgi:cytochrome c oxidase subunit IV